MGISIIIPTFQGAVPFPMVTVCPQTSDGVAFARNFYNDKERPRTPQEIEEERNMFYTMKGAVFHKLLLSERFQSN